MKRTSIAVLALLAAAVGAHAAPKGYTYQAPTYTAPSYPAPKYTTPAYGYGTGANPSATYVSPTIRNDGAMVPGHMRSMPNSTQLDNYNTRGNVNPYTGQPGTRSPKY